MRREGIGRRKTRLCRQKAAGVAVMLAVAAMIGSQARADDINPFLGKPTVERAQEQAKKRERVAERPPFPAPPMPIPAYPPMLPVSVVPGPQQTASVQGKQENDSPAVQWRAIGRVGTLITISDGFRAVSIPDGTSAEGCFVAWPDVACGKEGLRLGELDGEVKDLKKSVAEKERVLAEKSREATGATERLHRLQAILEGEGKKDEKTK